MTKKKKNNNKILSNDEIQIIVLSPRLDVILLYATFGPEKSDVHENALWFVVQKQKT